MTMRDITSAFNAAPSLAPAVRTNGTANGQSVDLQGFDAAMALVTFGTWSDGTHTPKLQHSDDGTSFSDVAAEDLDGAFVALSASAGQNAAQCVGYRGARRYLRVVLTGAGATSGAASAAHIVRGFAHRA